MARLPKQYFASTHGAEAYRETTGETTGETSGETIEWEELPSLADSLSTRLVARGALAGAAAGTSADAPPVFAAPWTATMAAELDAVPPSQPFREALSGLATREVNEPGVFQHFFGPHAHER